MDAFMSHADDLAEGNLRIPGSRFFADPAGGFADGLDQMDEGELKCVVGVEIGARLASHFVDGFLSCFIHVRQVNRIILHRAPRHFEERKSEFADGGIFR